MVATHSQLKQIEFSLGVGDPSTPTQFECQVMTWNIANNTEDGEKVFTFCPDGEYREDTVPDYALEFTFIADWTDGGVSDFLTLNDGAVADFTLSHHPEDPDQNVQWVGTCKIKAPNVGGEARTGERSEVTMPIIGEPAYSRVTAA